MNENNKRALFDAVSGIDDDLIDEAAAPRVRTLPRRLLRFGAVAAALAILLTALLWPSGEEDYITAPGLLSVRTYALDDSVIDEINSTTLAVGVELPRSYDWSMGLNCVTGFPLYLSFPEDIYPDAEISFKITMSGGECWDRYCNNYGQDFTIENNSTIYWNHLHWLLQKIDDEKRHGSAKSNNRDSFNGDQAFVDIIIYADDHIVGYSVVEIFEVNGSTGTDAYIYNAHLLELTSFPLVDGRYQEVSQQYVELLMNNVHTIAAK